MNRLDIIPKPDRGIVGESILHMSLSSRRNINLSLAAEIGTSWRQIQEALGTNFLERLGYIPDEFLEEVAYQCKEPSVMEEIIEKMAKNTGASRSAGVLRIRSRFWRGTDQLRNLCLSFVLNYYPSSWVDAAPGILAAEILSEQFFEDSSIKLELESAIAKVRVPDAIIIALCGGWPDSPILKSFLDSPGYKSFALPARINLRAHFDSPKEFVGRLSVLLPELSGNIWEFLPSSVRAIVSRLHRDAEAREDLFLHLDNNPTFAEKCNFPLLICRTDTRVDRLRIWCREELHRQTSGEHLPDVALDIFSGRIRSVGHILLEILTS